ncbi:MAG: hypothetical protein SH818_17330 [Saprospiraceae bacterium]|nr:hypothetical protein [Saprospiraceae bacterium]
MNKEHLVLITLIQGVCYTLIWLIHDYTALLLSAAIALITLAILVISWIADRLEYANVPFWYYPLLWISILVPVGISVLFWIFKEGKMDWMKPIF